LLSNVQDFLLAMRPFTNIFIPNTMSWFSTYPELIKGDRNEGIAANTGNPIFLTVSLSIIVLIT